MIAWLLTLALATAGSAERVSASLVLRVDDRDAVSEALIDDARSAGGWFSLLERDGLTLRIPVDDVDTFLGDAEARGEVVERTYSRSDQARERTDLEARLSVRRETLQRLLDVLAEAKPGAITRLETEISRLIREIEELEGVLRVLDDRAAYAEVAVRFVFRDRRPPRRLRDSSFAWLRTLHMEQLLRDFANGATPRSRSRASVTAPAGFAPYDKPAKFRAVSPDNVVFRVRSERNKPAAELAFWAEAMRTQLQDSGYVLISERSVESADGSPGALVEVSAANGERDQTWLITIFDKGRWLVIAEASGEAEAFSKHREAVVTAIGEIEL